MFNTTHTSLQKQAEPSQTRGQGLSDGVQSNHACRRGLCLLGAIAIAATTLMQAGCSSRMRGLSRDLTDNLLIEYRDAVWSRRAYNLRYGNCDRPFGTHFRDGFCAGYMDVCDGGDGYVPALPPQEYRGYEYQSAEGAKCVNGWFEGYPAGVAAAKQDRTGEFSDMYISRMVNSAITQDKAKHMLPDDVPIIKPDNNTPTKQATGVDATAPPVPSNSQASINTEISYAAEASYVTGTFDPTLDGPAAASQVVPASSIMEPNNRQQPMLPPIVRSPGTASSTPPIVSANPANNTPLPMSMNRTANAKQVITNQFTR